MRWPTARTPAPALMDASALAPSLGRTYRSNLHACSLLISDSRRYE